MTDTGVGRRWLEGNGGERWSWPAERSAAAVPVQPVKTRKRRPSVASLIRQMKRAGVEIAGCQINHDGTVMVVRGKPDEMQIKAADDRNEWDTVQ